MGSFWLVAFFILLGLTLLMSVLATIQTREHRRYGRSCMSGLDRYNPSGRAVVFAPCKGVDVELAGNLRALLSQDYDDFEVTFLVDSPDDPACEVIRRVMAESPWVTTRLVVTGQATTSGQKVHNLRVGTSQLGSEIEYLAFVDSDARPRREWLRMMVTRLSPSHPAAVTGYRWFVPTRSTLANRLLYSMNCRVMALLGRNSHCLIWGGSWGIRRDVFDSIGLRDVWRNTINDDLAASRQLRRRGLSVRFEPACVVASPLDSSPRQMFSFLRRQYLFGRYYMPDWWIFALLMSTLSSVGWLGGLTVAVIGLIGGTSLGWIAAGSLAVLYLLDVDRGRVRQDLIRTYFPERETELRSAARFDIWFGPLVALVHWLGVLGSAVGHRVRWRGIGYRVFSEGTIRSVRHQVETVRLSASEPRPVSSRELAEDLTAHHQ